MTSQGMSTERATGSQAGSLRDRLRFAGLDEAQCELLRQNRHVLSQPLKTALRDLFQRLQSSPDAARVFSSERQYDRLHDLLSSHWDVLTDARFDALYAERVKVLSDSESRMGLDPRWHVAGHAVVLEHLLTSALGEATGSSLLPSSRRRQREVTDLVGALVRLVMVDVDNFKMYNDHYGHAAGDRVLQQVALTLTAELRRPYDFIARYGGEEFVIILPDTPAEDSYRIIEGCREAILQLQIPHQATGGTVTISAGGFSCWPEQPDEVVSALALKQADDLLYQAKRQGKNRVLWTTAAIETQG